MHRSNDIGQKFLHLFWDQRTFHVTTTFFPFIRVWYLFRSLFLKSLLYLLYNTYTWLSPVLICLVRPSLSERSSDSQIPPEETNNRRRLMDQNFHFRFTRVWRLLLLGESSLRSWFRLGPRHRRLKVKSEIETTGRPDSPDSVWTSDVGPLVPETTRFPAK